MLVECVLMVALVVGVDGLEQGAYAQVVTPVLVEQNVASIERSLLQVVDECLFFEREFVKALYLVAEHLYVGKLFVGILKTIGSLRLCAKGRCGSYHHGGYCMFHKNDVLIELVL